MDKRIGWNFDSGQHATFNPLRPIALRRSKTVTSPPGSKTDSQFHGSRARFPDQNRMIGGPAINMRIFHRRFVLRAGVVALILIALWVIAIGPEPPSRITISPEEKAKWVKACEPVTAAWINQVKEKGLDGNKLIEQAKALVAKYDKA